MCGELIVTITLATLVLIGRLMILAINFSGMFLCFNNAGIGN